MKILVGAGLISAVVASAYTTGAAAPVARSATPALPSMQAPAQQPKVAMRFVVEGDSNKARYRVRERLAGRDLDNDAIGETPKVTGTIALDAKGKIIPTESQFAAEVGALTSDRTQRDNYVRRRLLMTDSFPTTTLKITEVRGLPSPLPKSGQANFQLVGDLTVRGVTRPTTWNVTATLNGSRLTGTAATRFTFADFQIPQPRVPIVLSVADTIGLEYDFIMTKK